MRKSTRSNTSSRTSLLCEASTARTPINFALMLRGAPPSSVLREISISMVPLCMRWSRVSCSLAAYSKQFAASSSTDPPASAAAPPPCVREPITAIRGTAELCRSLDAILGAASNKTDRPWRPLARSCLSPLCKKGSSTFSASCSKFTSASFGRSSSPSSAKTVARSVLRRSGQEVTFMADSKHWCRSVVATTGFPNLPCLRRVSSSLTSARMPARGASTSSPSSPEAIASLMAVSASTSSGSKTWPSKRACCAIDAA
mmetsp:Transcript_27350/g.63785  ORF Transcript_27350/g.63785 Transcript_27350/m.63785 type:complete len:258 (+) Transcript_27350:1457-2230(+)